MTPTPPKNQVLLLTKKLVARPRMPVVNGGAMDLFPLAPITTQPKRRK